MTTLQSLTIKTPDQIGDDYLRTYANGLKQRGVTQPNTSKGTEIYIRSRSLAQQIYAAAVAVPAVADAQMPDSAQADDLVRVAAQYGIALRAAGSSVGSVTLASTVTSAVGIVQGSQLIDPSGLTYQVAVGGQYANGSSVPVVAVSTGASTNVPAGTPLRWVAPPPYVQPTASVATGGLTQGRDADAYEDLRTRLLSRLRNPPNGSNWASAKQFAEDSTVAVQQAFVYQAANGPSTLHVAVTRSTTSTNTNRDVDSLTLTNVTAPAVLSQYDEGIEIVVTTVANYQVSVAFSMSLPASTTASPPGPGGGWTDANPFPVQASTGYVAASAVTNSTVFTVSSDTPPIVGSQACWLSQDDWNLRSATVLSFTGTNPYTITIDTPFVSNNGVTIAAGDYVFPNATNMPTYIAAVLAGFNAMGPGEKTNAAALLPRAYRRPIPIQSWPYSLTGPFLRNLENAGQEVASASYLYQSAVTPPLPTSIANPPNIFVPQRIGIYPG